MNERQREKNTSGFADGGDCTTPVGEYLKPVRTCTHGYCLFA